ncbi:uncharacterized protein TNCV_2968851 [Trichonephila clavipes]|nr:uncharacterized protein TNCV_2968851 [Trichonephila clavipes]
MEYNAPKSENSIDNLCYTQFIRSTKLNKSVQLSNLPPTSAAAHQHISRVYYQVQTCSAYPGPSRPLGARPKRPIDKTALASRGLWATDHVILNHGQVTWTTPELAPPLLTTTPHQREDVSALDRFKVHRCPTRWVFSGTGLELMTRHKLENVDILKNSTSEFVIHPPWGTISSSTRPRFVGARCAQLISFRSPSPLRLQHLHYISTNYFEYHGFFLRGLAVK